jgi:hypothetical integral membrane protein (TIGR02206 family)
MISDSAFFDSDIAFVPFGESHIFVLLVFTLLLAPTIAAGRGLDYERNLLISRLGSLFLFVTLIAWTIVHIKLGRFNLAVNLPLSICNLFALIAPLLFWNPNERRFEITYYFILSGTLQAIITPDPNSGFPSYSFFKYWIIHCGLVLIVVHHHFAFRLYPRLRGILPTFVWLNVYIVCLIPLNIWLGSNYFYMMEKPAYPTLLDYFGPWPIYIIVTEILAMVFFALAYVPIMISKTYFFKLDTMVYQSSWSSKNESS